MANTELIYLQYCKQLIEAELSWVNSQKWKQRDYLSLIDLIEERTGISLSLSTIKRIWKKEFAGVPQPATLDALAVFLGYDNWMQFKQSNQDAVSKEPARPGKRLPYRTILIISGLVIVAFLLVVLLQRFEPAPVKSKLNFDPEDVEFTCDFSASGSVPNTVIFQYDVENVEADSFFIQQSWDELQRERIPKTEEYLTSIYYFPGFHRAKLIANDSIIRETTVRILTNDWLAMVRNGYMDNFPVYIRDRDLAGKGELHVAKKHLDGSQVVLNQNTLVSYYYVTDFNGISSSNYLLQTRVRCDSIFNFTCPHITIVILGEDDMNFIPLTIRGCVGFVNIKMGDITKSGKNSDLSLFGVDIYRWQELEVKVRDNVATIMLNGVQVLVLPFEKDIGNIVGFNFNFSGTGTVDYVTLGDQDGRKVYSTEFESGVEL